MTSSISRARLGKHKPIAARPWQLPLITTVFTVALAQAAFASSSTSAQKLMSATVRGTTLIQGGPAGPNVYSAPETRDDMETGVKAQIAGPSSLSSPLHAQIRRHSNLAIPSKEAARLGLAAAGSRASGAQAPLALSTLPGPPTTNPNPTGRSVTDVSARTFGFDGLDHADQRLAGTGAYTNTQFSLEPPDQGLCAGHGFVLEAVNNAIQVFDTSGNALSSPVALSQFWGLAPEVDRVNVVFGPFVSDPKCAYDHESGHWFVSELEIDTDPATGAFVGHSHNLLAVSKTADPRAGFVVVSYAVTDDGSDGTPSHPGCPCLGDQPLLGFDHDGVYQSTNEFSLFGPQFNGAQIYALSKAALIAAAEGNTSPITVVAIDAGALPAPSGGTWYSLQPAVAGSPEDDQGSGAEYFLSALQFGVPPYQALDNRIAVWALTNTHSLSTAAPALGLSFQVMASETYGQPNNAQQKAGPTPLGNAVSDPEELLSTNDDRMNQVVYANGLLYGAVNTIIGDGTRTGIAWFAVAPWLAKGAVSGKVVSQGYVAVNGETVMYPSVAATEDGSGLIGFTLVGPDYFPSAAYVSLGSSSSAVRIVAHGAAPDDGFTGYAAFGGSGVGRWGDYSAAVVDGSNIWFATEYIPNRPRTSLANWGTWVGKVNAQ